MKRENTHKRNQKKLGCTCAKCKECCRREPGWFLPHEVALAAALLGMGRDEFVAKFCAEHIEDGVFALSPAQKPGTTECVFLMRDGLCKIHEAKPHECRKAFGCEPETRHRRLREIIKRQWK